MSAIYDNCDFPLLPELKHCLKEGYRADFCVGYFNLRGWRSLEAEIDQFASGEGNNCRLLVGMQKLPNDELNSILAIGKRNQRMSNEQANQLKKVMAQEFRQQLTYSVPTSKDEATLKRLQAQLRSHKLEVRLFLRHLLHAKLYLIYRQDKITPRIGYVGSSNLTFSGLSGQGELNVEVTDRNDTKKLEDWFTERWEDSLSLDISKDLIEGLDKMEDSKHLSTNPFQKVPQDYTRKVADNAFAKLSNTKEGRDMSDVIARWRINQALLQQYGSIAGGKKIVYMEVNQTLLQQYGSVAGGKKKVQKVLDDIIAEAEIGADVSEKVQVVEALVADSNATHYTSGRLEDLYKRLEEISGKSAKTTEE